jgi:NDP-sugar pyrophosphorylase family protein
MKIDSVLILAAGRGTRLKQHTDNLPKSLLPLGDTNILRNLIEQSVKYFAGAKIYVNASYLASKIINEITNFPINIRPYVIWEQEPLGPAFTVTQHCNISDGNVLVIHGDIYFADLTLSNFANSINEKSQNVSILLCHKRILENARSVISEENGIIKSISEIIFSDLAKNIDESRLQELVWSSSGALVVKRESLLDFIPDKAASLSPSLINHIAINEDLYLEKCSENRISIDDEKSYLSAIEINLSSPKLFKRTF